MKNPMFIYDVRMLISSFKYSFIAGIIASSTYAGSAWAETLWSYEGLNNGQDRWAMLSKDFIKCETGTQQSPVVIAHTENADLPALNFQYKQDLATIYHDDNSLNIQLKGENFLLIDNVKYQLKEIQFHSPSEHTVRDKFYLLEIHLVHFSEEGKQLNLAIFADTGSSGHSGLSPIIDNLSVKEKTFKFNPTYLLPTSFGYYSYEGSITMPPCTEGVSWRVLKRPIAISTKQLKTITKIVGRNSRLEQPIYTRIMKETNY